MSDNRSSDVSDLPRPLADYLDASRVALAIASADGDNPLLYVNPAFCALTGYRPDDVVGQNCRMLQRDADNAEAKARIHEFLSRDRQPNVRTTIINFRKDGTPFVNLLYMSRLSGAGRTMRYIFASQFDVSRSQPDKLADYDAELSATLGKLAPIAGDAGIILEGTLMAIANSAATIAQAKLTLADLEAVTHG
ncbi:histidine kinase [Sphingomonas sp. Leaf33]|uniref:PAS domain-containing protein n=1 Tax=Sphingomonas sp. Leaf33 TaxID=1736215 RepID=UPI0006FBD5B8|nr:PAS domain-containing protein [Sphingomonas sp. Leaf33]KQN19413.1 histidine kinase [Sphingomonas sp. Leaf33]